MTVSEYARRYRVSEQTVRNLCRTGKLPAVKVGRLFRIPNHKTTEE